MNRTVLFVAVMCLFSASPIYAECDDSLNEVFAENHCTKIRTYKSTELTNRPILLVALHGDSPFNNPGYQYRFAQIAAKKSSNLISVGMLRPGYTDPSGRTSDGVKGKAIGDNYDEKRVNQLAQAIKELKKLYYPSTVILAGHSGGAAITANIISLFPSLVDHAFIVSCPCDVNAWREDMYALTNKSIFKGNIDALSPIDLVDRLSKRTTLSVFVGKDDKVAMPYLSEKYKEAVAKKGLNVSLTLIEGQHDIFLNPVIMDELTGIMMEYNKAYSADAENRTAD